MSGMSVSPCALVWMPRAASRPSLCASSRRRTHAHRHHQLVKFDLFAALHDGLARLEPRGAVAQQECHILRFAVLLHHLRSFRVQNRREHLLRQIADGHARHAVADALQTLHANQARADNQYARIFRQAVRQFMRVPERHERVIMYAFQPRNRRHQRLRARRQQQLVIGVHVAVRTRNGLFVLVNRHRRHAGAEIHSVARVEIRRLVAHSGFVRLAAEQVGNQRAGVGKFVFLGQQGDFARVICAPDGFRRRGRRRPVADNHILHALLTSPRRQSPDSGSS